MSGLKEPRPVKLLMGVIFAGRDLLEPLEAELEHRFGPIELKSQLFSFDATGYYEDEMGGTLKRIFYAFRDLIDPGKIVDAKLAANGIEQAFASGGKRRVNIDPGYLDFHKLILVSGKFLSQKIYLGKGVYADPTLYYDKGWKPYDWGFPDFKSGMYYEFFSEVRAAYKTRIREIEH
ncbi:MAG: DUF4416 family protein [Candidatus Eisenbacteria bacterium]